MNNPKTKTEVEKKKSRVRKTEGRSRFVKKNGEDPQDFSTYPSFTSRPSWVLLNKGIL
jgi:hypothetical protein